MKYFLSFMGYPRSGHTLVASILNANPNVICSNQQNFLADINNYNKDKMLNQIVATQNEYAKAIVPKVPKQEITVMGDKTGHRTTTILGNHPHKLGKLKSMVGVPIKWIHVVRNPFDNLATWAKLNYENAMKTTGSGDINKEIDKVTEKYIELNETIAKLKRSEDVLTVRHEYVVTRMHNTLEEMAEFLEISFDPIWRDNVRNTVWSKANITRRNVPWTNAQKGTVHNIINQYEWLNGYDFGGCGRC